MQMHETQEDEVPTVAMVECRPASSSRHCFVAPRVSDAHPETLFRRELLSLACLLHYRMYVDVLAPKGAVRPTHFLSRLRPFATGNGQWATRRMNHHWSWILFIVRTRYPHDLINNSRRVDRTRRLEGPTGAYP